MIGPVEQGHRPLYEAHTTSKMERGVSFSVADQWVSISFEEILDDFMLVGDDGKVERGLCVCVCMCTCISRFRHVVYGSNSYTSLYILPNKRTCANRTRVIRIRAQRNVPKLI